MLRYRGMLSFETDYPQWLRNVHVFMYAGRRLKNDVMAAGAAIIREGPFSVPLFPFTYTEGNTATWNGKL